MGTSIRIVCNIYIYLLQHIYCIISINNNAEILKFIYSTTSPSGNMTIERNFNTAVTEFQRRFHISADEENRHRSSINQVILAVV